MGRVHFRSVTASYFHFEVNPVQNARAFSSVLNIP